MVDKNKRTKGFRTNTEKVKARADRMDKGGLFWTPKAGKSQIRVLPPWNEEGIFYLETAIHYGFKSEEEFRAYPCLKHLKEPFCPACQLVARFKDDKDSDVKKLMQQMKPKGKWFMNIIDRKAESPDVRIFGAGFKVASAIIGYFTDEDYGDITDPEEGRDVVIEREGTGFSTRYEVRIGAKPKPIAVEGWEEKLHDLSSEAIRETLNYEEMLEKVEQIADEHNLDLAGLFKKPKKVKKVVDEEEPEEEPEEEEAPAPVKKPAKTVKKTVTQDDDDDLDDDDND